MARSKKTGPAPQGDEARLFDQLGGRIDKQATGLRRGVQAITTPKEAVEAMVAAGAVFAVQRRTDTLGMSFTFSVAPGGDLERARQILVMVKARPSQFFDAFKALVAGENVG